MQKNVGDIERIASVTAGAALLVLAAHRTTRRRIPTAVTALGLLARGATGYCPVNAATGRGRRRDDPRLALSGNRGVRIAERTTIRATVDELYDFWRKAENLPRIVPHLERVETIDDVRSRWTMRGPGGVPFTWEARLINDIPGEKIAWESLPGADVVSAGSVTFTPVADDRTRVDVVLQYDPPAGKVGAAVARIVGRSPAADVRASLRGLKRWIETGDSRGGLIAVEQVR